MTTLPADYQRAFSIDLQKDKKLFLLVNGLCLVIAALLLGVGAALHPLGAFLQFMKQSVREGRYLQYFAPLLLISLGSFAYIILHEVIHGIFMYAFSRVKPKFGFSGAYAYAGSEVYFAKTPYLIIALAPVVIWGIVLAVLCAAVPEHWFWPLYFIQLVNLSGAAGDLYVTWRFCTLPKDILVQDLGVSMTVFQRNQ